MAEYKVFFTNGSTDVVEADSAADAKEVASEFGRVKKVLILDCDELVERENPEDDSAEDEDADEEDADEENADEDED